MATYLPPCRRAGATLLEGLVVLVVLGVLAALLLPVLGNMRARNAQVTCVNNLRQLGAATFQYAADHRQLLPAYAIDAGHGPPGQSLVTAGTTAGLWFYNLAPYVGVPRREVDGYSALERMELGATAAGIEKPCIFTCPAHSRKESNFYWTPDPMTWPSTIPVSYSTNAFHIGAAASAGGYTGEADRVVRGFPLSSVVAPGRKIWLMDCADAYGAIVSSQGRWSPQGDRNYNTLYQGFTRHSEGGNALFFDGHVEWLPLTTFTEPANGSFDRTILLYFAPLRHPSQDQ